ncbi:MAG: hypothetical protein AWU57_485 [Marinobacter sp. T13-3]|nr:MAG: hypothetical protein AWU57_485 [Marinobacter sp. T13-3]
MTDPIRLYLEPECCVNPHDGRTWHTRPDACAHNQPWTPYILKSEYDALKDGMQQENDTLKARVAELEAALRESQDWNWIEAREDAEEAGRDTFEIPEMQALADLAEHSHAPLGTPDTTPPPQISEHDRAETLAFIARELQNTVQEYRDMPCDSLEQRMFATVDRYRPQVTELSHTTTKDT